MALILLLKVSIYWAVWYDILPLVVGNRFIFWVVHGHVNCSNTNTFIVRLNIYVMASYSGSAADFASLLLSTSVDTTDKLISACVESLLAKSYLHDSYVVHNIRDLAIIMVCVVSILACLIGSQGQHFSGTTGHLLS